MSTHRPLRPQGRHNTSIKTTVHNKPAGQKIETTHVTETGKPIRK